jgi:hypothetical protein
MANYNIYGHVLYSEIQYEDLMHQTEKIFIRSLMAKVPDITDWTNTIWNDIDHEYMIRTLEEIKDDVIRSDIAEYFKYDKTAVNITTLNELVDKVKKKAWQTKDFYKINDLEAFRKEERKFGKDIANAYKTRIKTIDSMDEMEYLTQQIKNFNELEQTIPYKHNGETIRTVTPSTYLSMLYNVNITRTGWNTTFKDAQYFGKDIVMLVPHPLGCPDCTSQMGKLFSISGKSDKYPSIEKAYEHNVGHPNCKCEFPIIWSEEQIKTVPDNIKATDEEYKQSQKKRAIEREIRKAENDLDLFNMIGNQAEVDKTIQKIAKLNEKL